MSLEHLPGRITPFSLSAHLYLFLDCRLPLSVSQNHELRLIYRRASAIHTQRSIYSEDYNPSPEQFLLSLCWWLQLNHFWILSVVIGSHFPPNSMSTFFSSIQSRSWNVKLPLCFLTLWSTYVLAAQSCLTLRHPGL